MVFIMVTKVISRPFKQSIWLMVVNEGVFLIENTCFHVMEIIECFVKLFVSEMNPKMGSFINSGPKGPVM